MRHYQIRELNMWIFKSNLERRVAELEKVCSLIMLTHLGEIFEDEPTQKKAPKYGVTKSGHPRRKPGPKKTKKTK